MDDGASVNFPNIRAGVAKACRNHLPIEFVHRPALDHDPLMEKTIDRKLDWVRARLDAKPWNCNCGSAIPQFALAAHALVAWHVCMARS